MQDSDANRSVLAEIETLEILGLPERFRDRAEFGVEALRTHARRRRIGFEAADGLRTSGLPTAAEVWSTWRREDTAIARFRAAGIKAKIKILPDHEWEVSLDDQPVKDLSPLQSGRVARLMLRNTPLTDFKQLAGMPLKALSIRGAKVSDLAPLSGIPLVELEISKTRFVDLGALRGMPLRRLDIGETAVTNLSPLPGMALQEFWTGTTRVADLSPLKGMPLRLLSVVDCPQLADVSPLLDVRTLEQVLLPKAARNVEVLRALANLRFISFEADRKKKSATAQQLGPRRARLPPSSPRSP
jgi:hypothetical protein